MHFFLVTCKMSRSSRTLTGMQKTMRMRSALARPPRNILVGVAGRGRSLGHSVDAIITRLPEQL